MIAPAVHELATLAQDPNDHPRRWRWMGGLFR